MSRSIAAALLAVTLGVASVACSGVDGRPEGAPIVVTTDVVDPSAAARSAEAARDQAARASVEQSRLGASSAASVSSASSAASASASSAAEVAAAAEAARVAAEQEAAGEQARQQAEQEAAASAAAEAERGAAEEAAAAQEQAQRQAAEDQARFDAALASGTCTDAPEERVIECVGLAEDSVPPGDAGADGASPDDGAGGWYDSHGNWVSPETAARAQAQGIPVGGDVPGYLRCGTLCGESPTSGEIQWENYQRDQANAGGTNTGSGG